MMLGLRARRTQRKRVRDVGSVLAEHLNRRDAELLAPYIESDELRVVGNRYPEVHIQCPHGWGFIVEMRLGERPHLYIALNPEYGPLEPPRRVCSSPLATVTGADVVLAYVLWAKNCGAGEPLLCKFASRYC